MRCLFAIVTAAVSLLVTAAPADAKPAMRPPAPTRACGEFGYVAPANAQLELVLRQGRRRGVLEVGLRNLGPTPVCVWSREAGYDQSAWLTLALVDRHGAGRALRLWSGVDKSTTPVATLVAPRDIAWQRFDLRAWARATPNEGGALRRGRYQLTATYDSSRDKTAWRGQLQASMRFKAR